MKEMIVFSRRCMCGTDDLVFIGVIEIFLYLAWPTWFSFKVYNWFFFDEKFFSGSSVFHDIAMASFFGSMTFQFLLAVGFIYFSTRGTMTQQAAARLPCVTLFHLKVIVSLLGGSLWLVYSGYLFHKSDFSSDNMKYELMVVTAVQLSLTVFQFPGFVLFFDSEGSLKEDDTRKETSQTNAIIVPSLRSRLCRVFFRVFSCLHLFLIPWEVTRRAIISIYDIIVYVPHEAGILIGDFLAGSILLQQEHKRHFLKEERLLNSQQAIILSDGSPVNHFPTADMPAWMNLHLAQRYYSAGVGAFVESLWSRFRNEVCRFKRLWNYLMWCLSFRKQYESDDCCHTSAARIRLNCSLPYKDSLHVSFQNKVYLIPFMIAVDVYSSAILIIVGGQMSANEILTDTITRVSSKKDSGCLENNKCHDGMLKAAVRIKERLESARILETALKSSPNYHLVTTGQNLGASIAAILSLLLRPSHPTARCYAFEPIPCIGVRDLKTTFDLVFSVVFGNEIIPYLDFHKVEHMVRQIIQCTKECNLPKYKLFYWPPSDVKDDEDSNLHKNKATGKILPRIFIERGETASDETEKKEKPEGRQKSKHEVKFGEEYNEEVEKGIVKKRTSSNSVDNTTLFVPGRVLHIRSIKKGYRLQIRTAEDIHPLLIYPGMTIRHSPQYIEGCLEKLGRTYTLLSTSL